MTEDTSVCAGHLFSFPGNWAFSLSNRKRRAKLFHREMSTDVKSENSILSFRRSFTLDDKKKILNRKYKFNNTALCRKDGCFTSLQYQ